MRYVTGMTKTVPFIVALVLGGAYALGISALRTLVVWLDTLPL
jgi:hypothetical protein